MSRRITLQDMIAHYKGIDLNGDEILELVGKAPVLYSNLSRYSNIDQLLGNEGYAIVLYQTSSISSGHYVAITRNAMGKYRYCDSYGLPNPDTELQYTPFDQPLPKYLTKLLAGTGYESNTFDYQRKNPGVSTCGRWSAIFCKLRNLSLTQIQELFTLNSDPILRDPDNSACLLTFLSLRDIPLYYSGLSR